ncbi:MAG: peptidylprolyl isomerase [Magnetococcales bacterium]|nr:peptidylprolyl isomerase [Magnetococcales bacterium]
MKRRGTGKGWGVGWVLLLLVVGAVPIETSLAEVLDRIVAVVEGRIITESEVNRTMGPLMQKLRVSGGSVDAEKVRSRVLDELVLRRLREEQAKKLGIKVEKADVDSALARIERKNGLPPGGLPKALQQEGIDMAGYQEEVMDQLIQSRLIQKVIQPMVTVGAEEVDALMRNDGSASRDEEIELGHILLATPANASDGAVEQVLTKARQMVLEMQQGVSLASLASQYSDDPSSLKGGNMGWFKRGELPSEVEQAVFRLARGEIAGPMRSSQGFHIFQLINRRQTAMESAQDKQFKIRHILVKVERGASLEEVAAAREKLTTFRRELDREKGDFAELARRVSEDVTASDGGDLGWVGQGELSGELDGALLRLGKGEISGPVRSEFGWHLLKLEDMRGGSSARSQASRSELENRVYESKVQSRFRQWMRDVRLRAYVETM